MRTNKLKFQSIFLIIGQFMAVISLLAQETTTIDRLNFKLSYAKYSDTDFIFYSTSNDNNGKDLNDVGNFRLSSAYKLNKFMDAGLYFGYSLYQTTIPIVPDSSNSGWSGYSYESANSIMYGINLITHILPFFIEKERSRFDVYSSLQYGGIHLFEPEGGVNTKKNYSEFGIFGGLAFYPFKHLGIYAEYGYSKYANLRYGLSLQF